MNKISAVFMPEAIERLVFRKFPRESDGLEGSPKQIGVPAFSGQS